MSVSKLSPLKLPSAITTDRLAWARESAWKELFSRGDKGLIERRSAGVAAFEHIARPYERLAIGLYSGASICAAGGSR